MDSKPEIQIPRRYSFWRYPTDRRIFQVIDTPLDGMGEIVLLEIRVYLDTEKHVIQHLTPMDWMLLIEDYKFKACVPMI